MSAEGAARGAQAKYYGFNMLWMYVAGHGKPKSADERALDFIAGEGFNFIRLPLDYRFIEPEGGFGNADEDALGVLDDYIQKCNERGLHACVNLHRAPGYCINWPEREKYNLWRDERAQSDFISLWLMLTKRYRHISADKLSFDLVNEPESIPPTHPCTRQEHEALIRRTLRAIRAEDPARRIVIDGFHGGHASLPELADLSINEGVVHSGRGYMPFELTHHKADWVRGGDMDAPAPTYPGVSARGENWDKEYLRRFYAPWKELSDRGVHVHIGEFGCYNKTDNSDALRWFRDLTELFCENGWGYALWNFRGPFGIVEHGRPNAKYEYYKGYNVDKALLDILKPDKSDRFYKQII
ncbi:MAG: cellulase family glycosylhydrolase [Clostridia bacterium]|nr:cellulase family glycosylhydrolase [Clostridia bacterium]